MTARTAKRNGLSGGWRMDHVLQEFPSAQNVLLEKYGINRLKGPGAVGYEPADSLATVALNHGVEVDALIEQIELGQDIAKQLEIMVWETSDLMKNGKVVLLDVRTPEAFAMASIPGSVLVDDALAQEVVQKWPRDIPIVLVCHHGMRSLDAADYLRRHGFVNTRSLSGGVDAWSLEIDSTVPRY